MRAWAKRNFLLIINIFRLIFHIFIFILNGFLITLFWKNILHMALSYPIYWTLIFIILLLNYYLLLVYLPIFYRRNIIYLLVFFGNHTSLFLGLSLSRIHYFCWCILFYNSRLDILFCIHIMRLNLICLYFVLWRYNFMNWTFWRYWSLWNLWFILLDTFLLHDSDKIFIWFWNRFVFFYLWR